MHLSLRHEATTFPQQGYPYGFAFSAEENPHCWYHVLTPDAYARDRSICRTGTILVYVVNHSNPSPFAPKEMLPPRRDIIEALRAQWATLSDEYIRRRTDLLDQFEDDEDTVDDDGRAIIDRSKLSFELASAFFAAPDFNIAPRPLAGTMGYLISADPLPPQA